MDLSSAVEATAKTIARFPNADVVQGSIRDPPFREGAFDFCYCIGVQQHTPDPPRAVRTLVARLRSGGGFALTAYGRRPWTKSSPNYLLRPLTRRMNPANLLGITSRAMPLLFAL